MMEQVNTHKNENLDEVRMNRLIEQGDKVLNAGRFAIRELQREMGIVFPCEKHKETVFPTSTRE
jgi:hypothetical protein